MKRFFLYILLFSTTLASAQVVRDSVKIYFPQGKFKLDSLFMTNEQVLGKIEHSVLRLEKVEVIGTSSPEGSVNLNKRLSQKRANILFNYLSRYDYLSESRKTIRFIGRDWNGLIELVRHDEKVPYRDESLALLEKIAREEASGKKSKTDPFWRLVALRDGKPYRYMYYNLFPKLRASQVNLWFREIVKPVEFLPVSFSKEIPDFQPETLATVATEKPELPLYWALKTNALYDVLAIPNIGAEFYIGKNWSVGANWMYAWWKHDTKHWYWRVYGGDVYVRKWFGKKANEKPLTGHHIGVYAQMLTYDFETGGRGYMGGKPGGSLLNKANFAGGVEYGYSHPIARRLNLDFTLGIGYLGGEYHEYIPMDDCYVWQATKYRHWFGPTKAEVSLVWLLGRTNYNAKKGGLR